MFKRQSYKDLLFYIQNNKVIQYLHVLFPKSTKYFPNKKPFLFPETVF